MLHLKTTLFEIQQFAASPMPPAIAGILHPAASRFLYHFNAAKVCLFIALCKQNRQKCAYFYFECAFLALYRSFSVFADFTILRAKNLQNGIFLRYQKYEPSGAQKGKKLCIAKRVVFPLQL